MLILNKIYSKHKTSSDKFRDFQFENAGFVQSKNPTNGEKGLLVFSKLYKNIREIPEVVLIEEITKAKSIANKKFLKCSIVCFIISIPIAYWLSGKIDKFIQDLREKQKLQLQSQNEAKTD